LGDDCCVSERRGESDALVTVEDHIEVGHEALDPIPGSAVPFSNHRRVVCDRLPGLGERDVLGV
jgi:hypothetical protein